MKIIGFLVIGLLAGWLAGQITKGRGFGCIGNILIGAIGALIGGFLFDQLGLDFGGFIGSLFTALVGAVVVLFIAGLLSRASS